MQNSLKPVSAGNIPDEVNVIIEIPAHSSPVKYEIVRVLNYFAFLFLIL
jgi:inorganic pyrophosphatase